MLLITVLKYLKMYNRSKLTNLTPDQHIKLDKAISLIEHVLQDLDMQGYYKEGTNEKVQ